MPGFDKVPGVNDDHEFPPLIKAAIQAELVVRDDVDFVLYGRGDGVELTIAYSILPLDNTIAHRDENGNLTAADPTEDEHLVTKAYADAIVPPYIVIEEGDSIPGGTPAGTLIFRSAP